MNELPPPDDDLAALFAAERTQRVVPEALHARVWRSVDHRLRFSPPSERPRPPFPGQALAALALGVAVGGVGGYLLGVRAVPSVGANLPAALSPTATPTNLPAALSPAPTPSTTAPPENSPAHPLATPPSASAPAQARTDAGETAPSPATTSSTAAEREGIDRGRAALGRGHGADALAAVADLERRFPGGALVEEREVLRIQALRQLGRTDEADRARGRFLARFPNSIYGDALK